MPDLVVFDHLEEDLRPIERLQFVSYATGAATLRSAGHRVIDLDLPDDAPFVEILVRAQKAIAGRRPAGVISHEEFAALPAAKTLDLPTLLMVDFFPPPKSTWLETLDHADRIVFIERRGIFAEPPRVKGKVDYVGPIVRPMEYGRADRARARTEMKLDDAALVVSVIPGAWATEARAPIVDLVRAAFEALASPKKNLVWIAGADADMLTTRFAPHAGIRVIKEHSPIERLMVASDVVITKGNRGTTIEAGALGVPSISLSFGLNPVDETILPRIRTNLPLDARGVDAPYLASVITDLAAQSNEADRFQPDPLYRSGGAAAAASVGAFIRALER